ncbi:hypothetical protein ACFL3D_01865 [Candidatus Omnitrophota bacterium]
MKTTREKFVEHYGVILCKELLERLPEEETPTMMLHYTGLIMSDVNTHLIHGIHQSLKEN